MNANIFNNAYSDDLSVVEFRVCVCIFIVLLFILFSELNMDYLSNKK